MPKFRCEYKVFGDFIFDDIKHVAKIGLRDSIEITFENWEDRKKNVETLLRVVVTGEAESLDIAEKALRGHLVRYLDKLSFITHARFKVVSPVWVIEWNEEQVEREYLVFQEYDGRYPPSPDLQPAFFKMAGFNFNENGEYLERALQYYRMGLLEENASIQHWLFWKVIEIIADKIVNKAVSPKVCENCSKDLRCKECDALQMNPPIAKESIGSVFKIAGPDNDGSMFKRHYAFRNHIVHGRPLKKGDPKADELVDEIQLVSRKLIGGGVFGINKAFDLPSFETSLNRKLVMIPRMLWTHKGPGPHPDPKTVTIPTISMETKYVPGDEETT